GCAACHSLKIDGSLVTASNTAQPLARLAGRGGCMEQASPKTPRYLLSEQQKTAIAAAIAEAKAPAKELPAGEYVERMMVRFNCVACHARGTLGGVMVARDSYFHSDMPEMGDEGRVPPSLTGVGAKLTANWLKTLFDQGGKDRPYMLTRMPKFGL